ncbi:multidrug efflux SMR transporter [Catenulispora sp. NF23]|uniref:Multidrug efflux SMR transporter n=1 Tax=Catenulispora pinistramenti TaxID=2705254 RepID=A0ABS5KZK9_9ACTN|nr:multidrug efflux SMR transporter [Catenulispora pinistramenti]MBS2537297.1 multidrug efflux SMR transporter [Catenulispora pinistramenti]MBS2551508.1 multidrug efflux SMR transporter [Catenulispora pinistramenti]
MAWAYLLIASAFEIVFALATDATHGFTVLGPSLLTVAAAAGGIFFLSLALKTLDVGVGYTVWTGIGSVGTVVFATALFHEAVTPAKVVAFTLIIGGVLGLKIADKLAAAQD